MRSISILAAVVVAGVIPAHAQEKSFRGAVGTHLDALSSRNLGDIKDTLTKNEDITVILPDGTTVEGAEAYLQFHRDWFADGEWVFEPQIVKLIEDRDMGVALIRTRYRDAPDAAPEARWLTLVFQKQGKHWRLVHNQNTAIGEVERRVVRKRIRMEEQDIDPTAVPTLRVGESYYDIESLVRAAAPFAREVEVTAEEIGAETRIVVTAKGYDDDSVAEERFTILTADGPRGLTVLTIEEERKCMRGEDWGWTTEACP